MTEEAAKYTARCNHAASITLGNAETPPVVRLGMRLVGDDELATVTITQHNKTITLNCTDSAHAGRIAEAIQGAPCDVWAVVADNGNIRAWSERRDHPTLAKLEAQGAAVVRVGGLTAVQGEPVGWQYYQDGKWWHVDAHIKDHRKNTEEAGYPIRDVYAAPQPSEQQPSLAKYQPCGCVVCTCEHETQCQGCGAHHCGTHPVGQLPESVHQNPAPDVEALVEALEEARRELNSCQSVIHYAGGFDPAYVTGAQAALVKIDAALAAHRKQGGE